MKNLSGKKNLRDIKKVKKGIKKLVSIDYQIQVQFLLNQQSLEER